MARDSLARRVLPWQWSRPEALWTTFGRGTVAALLAAGALLVIDVLVPLGKGLARAEITLALAWLAWAAILVAPVVATVRALRPAALAVASLAPLGFALLAVAVWDVGPSRALARLAWACLLGLLLALAAAMPLHGTRRHPGLALATLAALLASGAAVLVHVAGAELAARPLDSALRAVMSLVLVSAVFLVPLQRDWATRLLWAALAQFAAMQALDPWIDGALSERMVAASLGLLPLLVLAAFLTALLPVRRPAVAP